MSVFDEVRLAQKREREREERFAALIATFDVLSREEKLLILARLADRLGEEEGAETHPVKNAAPTVQEPSASTAGRGELRPVFGAGANGGAVLFEATDGLNEQDGATGLARRAVAEAAKPLEIAEIIAAVHRVRPETPKPFIYSAVYKMAKTGRFLKHADGTYTLNPNYRAGSRKEAATE